MFNQNDGIDVFFIFLTFEVCLSKEIAEEDDQQQD